MANDTETAESTDEGLEEGLGKAFDTLDGSASGGDEDDTDTQDETVDEADDEGSETDDETDEDAADDDEEDGGDDKPKGKVGAKTDEEEEEAEEEAQLDADFEEAAERHRLPTNVRDILAKVPKEARGAVVEVVGTRLKEMEAGFTRTIQQATVDRRELAKLRRERAFEEGNRVDMIAEWLDQDPKNLDRLNDELTKRDPEKGSAAYAEAKKMRLDDARKKLQDQADEDEQVTLRQHARADAIESLSRRLCREEGVPFEVVNDAIVLAIVNSHKDEAQRDLPDAAVRAIVKRSAAKWRGLTGERKADARKDYVKGKHQDRKDGQRRTSARDRGHSPAPGGAPKHKSLQSALLARAREVVPDMPDG